MFPSLHDQAERLYDVFPDKRNDTGVEEVWLNRKIRVLSETLR